MYEVRLYLLLAVPCSHTRVILRKKRIEIFLNHYCANRATYNGARRDAVSFNLILY